MAILEVEGLCKSYPGFHLDHISFQVREGSIMGFIGRNGAGKTTTLKSILGIVHTDAGQIRYQGMDMRENERRVKPLIGYAGGAVDYYKRKPISEIVRVTKTFYSNWDEAEYRRYMEAFSLDENKTPGQLSDGMRVKLNLVLALSHHAELLILDEPTSGLDPVSREELLEAFAFLRSRGVAILFSTHITSDLEKCADDITYIAGGKLISTGSLAAFLQDCRNKGIGESLDEIMIHFEKQPVRIDRQTEGSSDPYGNSMKTANAGTAGKGGEGK